MHGSFTFLLFVVIVVVVFVPEVPFFCCLFVLFVQMTLGIKCMFIVVRKHFPFHSNIWNLYKKRFSCIFYLFSVISFSFLLFCGFVRGLVIDLFSIFLKKIFFLFFCFILFPGLCFAAVLLYVKTLKHRNGSFYRLCLFKNLKIMSSLYYICFCFFFF